MDKHEIIEKLHKARKFLERIEKEVPEDIKEWLWTAKENIDYAVDDLENLNEDEEEDNEDLEEE